ncbi:MAG: homoserine kinase [Methylotenera sp.]|uniref:homoserine kinase n=1 Tax=Methylotenera sp. TaxID=2051956 RepID=UPI002717DB5C|nr:homoserine kinase [Methylotenera sp.]MDO9151734.1 homoserine kinase [Methylotenera sp.]
MSVFTSVSIQQLQAWLQDYPIGEVIDLKGISSGITNTNYFVTTTKSKYVLTLFEHNTIDELPYFIDLMHHLSEHGVPCPDPITNRSGVSLHMLNGKPAVLISCLNGRDIAAPNAVHCAEVGRVLAQMHQAGQTFAAQSSEQAHQNPRGAEWRKQTAQEVMAHLSTDDQKLLTETLAFQAELDTSALPKGIIHADLFRDNVLFDGDKVGGLIDFYYACYDVLAYDLAIVANDWCVQADGQLDAEKVEAMLKAYQAVRPFEQAEHAAWNGLLRIAALRFWLSRLYDQIYPQAGELTHAKDPDHFKNILKLRSA